MRPEDFQRIEALYHAARESGADERATLLASADPALRREVESLLVQRADGGFLEQPAIRNVVPVLDVSPLPELPVGASLGPYLVEGKLAAGGMGAVYRASDTRLGRAVAIKITRERFTAQFRREARAISALNHPNICTLYDVGPNYMVMELVEGETLAARIKSGGALPIKTALACALQILSALAEAHAKGIVHRDLKPGNIMLTKSGIKVLDFGLAKSSGDETLTAAGGVLGTPAYMSPEQRSGKPADVRSDIYSFGCVLHEMVTGTRMGARRTPIALRKLRAIIERCLEEDPANRWQTVAELQRQLAMVAADSGWLVVAGAHRRPVIAAACVLAAAAGVGAWLFLARPARALTDKDTVVLAGFANRTGDPVFDGTLRQGLAVQLEQSPFLSLVSDDRVRQTLPMMGLKSGAALAPPIARDLCERVGGTAVIEGSIAQVGAPYLLTLEAVDCVNGGTLASAAAQATDKDHVLEALGRASAQIRVELGESLRSVRKFDTPLEQATTTSLDALKAYSEAMQSMSTRSDTDAITPLFKRAVALDPHFAMAYGMLSLMYNDAGESGIAASYARKAWALRGNTSEPERYFIAARYNKEATGNIPAAIEACQLWIESYPRNWIPRTLLSGSIYPVIGEYAKAVAQGQESVRLDPSLPVGYGLLMNNYVALDRPEAAKAAYAVAHARKLVSDMYVLDLYHAAFLQHDVAGMARQAAAAVGQPGTEHLMLAAEAETAAWGGQLQKARALTRAAMDAATRADAQESAATYEVMSAVREALFGNAREAVHRATSALQRSTARDVQYGAALAFVFVGDDTRAEALANDLARRYPEDTLVQSNYLPALRAQIALDRRHPAEALAILGAATPYELGITRFNLIGWTAMYPIYVRGEAYLAAHQDREAAAEFRKILDHPGLLLNFPIGPMARLQRARAWSDAGERTEAAGAYREFLALWKNADPDVPALKRARVEFAALE